MGVKEGCGMGLFTRLRGSNRMTVSCRDTQEAQPLSSRCNLPLCMYLARVHGRTLETLAHFGRICSNNLAETRCS